jgi:hypothetical protein
VLVLFGAVSAAGASTKPRQAVSFSIPLPAPGKQRVERISIKLKITKGARALRLVPLNDGALPEGVRAVVAGVIPKTSRSKVVTYKLYILINNLAPPSPRRLQSAFNLDGEAFVSGAVVLGVAEAEIDDDCTILNALGDAADGDLGPLGFKIRWALQSMRAKTVQPSDPEAVLDFIVYDECAGDGAEVPDGDGPG